MSCDVELSSIWPDDLYIVCGDGELIEPGAASSTFPTMVGWKIRVIRGGAPLWFGNPGGGQLYFDYTSITAEATWNQLPEQDEQFIIQAYKPA